MLDAARRSHHSGAGRARVWLVALVVTVAGAIGLLTVAATTAAAHVVPTSSIQLDVHHTEVEAAVSVPVSDVQAASGIDLDDQSQVGVEAHAAAIKAYLVSRFAPTTDSGRLWAVSIGDLTVSTTGDPATTGRYQQLQTTVTLTPPAGSGVRSFNLGYTGIVDRVATHVVIVTVNDWAGGKVGGTYQAGVVQRDTVTNTIRPLHVDLGSGSNFRGLVSMVTLGMQHIEEGTDHQLFLLTLLLPAPLLVRARRWSAPVGVRTTVRRIATITLSFTLGHSVTLALGALGLPVPQRPVEALIAVSILVAAAHAIRPIFPGREAFIAAGFGLIHGLAFSETLRELDLNGIQLVLSLLGFNLGIEAMQLIVVAAVLPPLILLARSGRYQVLRTIAAVLTGVAAVGWLAARLGYANRVADAADGLGAVAVPLVVLLWLTAIISTVRSRRPAATPALSSDAGHSVVSALAGFAEDQPTAEPQLLSGSLALAAVVVGVTEDHALALRFAVAPRTLDPRIEPQRPDVTDHRGQDQQKDDQPTRHRDDPLPT